MPQKYFNFFWGSEKSHHTKKIKKKQKKNKKNKKNQKKSKKNLWIGKTPHIKKKLISFFFKYLLGIPIGKDKFKTSQNNDEITLYPRNTPAIPPQYPQNHVSQRILQGVQGRRPIFHGV